jgi:hypothetical protein
MGGKRMNYEETILVSLNLSSSWQSIRPSYPKISINITAIASDLNNDKSLIHSKCTMASDRQCRSSLLNKYIINQLVEEYIAEGK